MSVIELRAVNKHFDATAVLSDLSLAVAGGSITAVLGPSGSGKTTLLRLIAGFDRVDSGTITIGGRVVDDGRRALRAQHRGVGYVPQEGALFPHLTVSGNVGFGLARRERSAVSGLLDLVGLTGLARRFPHQLSGGQQQRVALARALAIRPSVVLLDEPFGALDAALRVGLRRDVARILTETATTTILVTHDQEEALALAQRIAVLDEGRIVAFDDPRALYSCPRDLTAARSIGEANILRAHTHAARPGHATCALGVLATVPAARESPVGACRVLIRPEQVVVHVESTAGATRATLEELQYHGHDALAVLRLQHPDRELLLARIAGDLVLEPGQEVWVQSTSPVRVWPAPTSVAPDEARTNRGERDAR